MNLFAATSLSCGIASAVLAIITSFFGRKKIHYLLLSFNSMFALWGLGLFMAGSAKTVPGAMIAWKEALVYSLSAGLLTGIFLLLIITLTKVLTVTVGRTSPSVTVVAALFIAILFDPLKVKVQGLLDRIFHKTSYEYYAAIKSLGRNLAVTTDLHSTFRFIVEGVFSLLSLKNVYLINETEGGFRPVFARFSQGSGAMKCFHSGDDAGGELFLSFDSPLVRLMNQKKKTVILEDHADPLPSGEWDAIEKEMARFQGRVALPVIIDQKLSAIVSLGEKQSEHIFTREDISLLETMSSQSAIAVRNARLYDELEERVRNRNFEGVSGFDPAEIAVMSPLDFISPGHQEKTEKMISKVFADGDAGLEAPIRNKEHKEIPYYLTGYRMEVDGREYLVGTGVDISARVAADAVPYPGPAYLCTGDL